MKGFLFDVGLGKVPDTQAEFRLLILGRPQQRGSKIPQVVYRGGQPVLTNGRPLVIARDQNDERSLPWMQEVKSVAVVAMRDQGFTELIDDAIEIEIQFYFKRPESHFGTGKNAGALRNAAPKCHTQSPDLDKLQRCFGDALTGVMYRDDKQVCRWIASRHWTTETERTEAIVRVRE
jgi:Holliday junction resolvase RusA-like endonuclease